MSTGIRGCFTDTLENLNEPGGAAANAIAGFPVEPEAVEGPGVADSVQQDEVHAYQQPMDNLLDFFLSAFLIGAGFGLLVDLLSASSTA